jgi:hypothetical protein
VYATVGIQHSEVGDRVVALDHLQSFNPQNLVNTVWVYATVKVWQVIICVQLNHLKTFNSQDFANTVWAYATAGVQHPDLFQKIGDHIITLDNLKSFMEMGKTW